MPSRRASWQGAVLLLPLILLVLTGIWLAWFSFSPTDPDMVGMPTMAELERIVARGAFYLALHKWMGYASLVGIGVWSYRAWSRGKLGALLGVMLLIVVLLEHLTGLLLPWDKAAMWVIQRNLPAIGGMPSAEEVFPEVLRWYGLHLVLLPLVGVGLAVVIWRRFRSTH